MWDASLNRAGAARPAGQTAVPRRARHTRAQEAGRLAAMLILAIKGIVAAVLVVGASELAQRSTVAGAILVSLPLVSILALCFLWVDTRDIDEVVAFSWSIMWVVLPSIVFFIALPLLVKAGLQFWPAIAGSAVTMIAAYAGYAWLMDRVGIEV